MARIIALAALTACVASSGASAASSFFGQYFPQDGRASNCYARGYQADHMAAHPKQRVTYFALDHQGDEPADASKPAGFVVNFSFTVKAIDDTFAGAAACTERGAGATCVAENGGGSFSLSAAGKGVSLAVGSNLRGAGWRTGKANLSPDLAVGGDDRVFLLSPSPAQACEVPPS